MTVNDENIEIHVIYWLKNIEISSDSAIKNIAILLFYYHTFEKENSTHNYEIDFIIERKAKLCPIEVKSGQSTVHSSLDAFMVKYSSKILTGYLIYPKDFKRDGNTWLLPVFMTGLI